MSYFDPALADRILQTILEDKIDPISDVIGEEYNLPEPVIRACMIEIRKRQSILFRLQTYGYGEVRAITANMELESIRLFLNQGGFVYEEVIERKKEQQRLDSVRTGPTYHTHVGGDFAGNIQQGDSSHFSNESTSLRNSTISTTATTEPSQNIKPSWLSRNKEWIIPAVIAVLSAILAVLGTYFSRK